jgi:hypothetical protein
VESRRPETSLVAVTDWWPAERAAGVSPSAVAFWETELELKLLLEAIPVWNWQFPQTRKSVMVQRTTIVTRLA